MTDRLSNHVFPTEEELGIFRLESCESFIWAHVDRLRRLPKLWPCAFELGVLSEDP